LKFSIQSFDLVHGCFQTFLFDSQLRRQLLDFGFRFGQGLLFWFNSLVHKVETVNTVDPHDDALAGCGGVFDCLYLQVWNIFRVVQVFAQIENHGFLSLFNFEVQQFIEKF
jgi:hypothetical protein